ncbi:MAG: 2-C-methyl-D-erythritol 4-phosphate cytidylyltransferase [Candidatus Omnitrophota bacterium]
MKTEAIIVAAGRGARLKSSVLKPFIRLDQKPLYAYCLKVFEACPLIDKIIIVVHRESFKDFARIIEKFRWKKVKAVVIGGATRRDSVRHGLNVLDKDTQLVAIHDVARPFINSEIISSAVRTAKTKGACVVGVPVKSTIKLVDPKKGIVQRTIPRDLLWEIQTPQVFKKDIILKAHKRNLTLKATDDAMLVERLGIKVSVVKGDYRNIKITTQEDLSLAKMLLVSKEK